MQILGIDPGSKHSGWALYDSLRHSIIASGYVECEFLREELLASRRSGWSRARVACESIEVIRMFTKRNQIVTPEISRSIRWEGDFRCASRASTLPFALVNRSDWTYWLTGVRNANDSDVRAAMYHQFGDGTRASAHGRKKTPGPLYKRTIHELDALGVALYAAQEKPWTT